MEKHDQTKLQIEEMISNWGAVSVTVTNNSHLHVGHEGAKSGGGHFAAAVVADLFQGLNRIQRHRLVYAVLDKLFIDGSIHALELEVFTPEEIR